MLHSASIIGYSKNDTHGTASPTNVLFSLLIGTVKLYSLLQIDVVRILFILQYLLLRNTLHPVCSNGCIDVLQMVLPLFCIPLRTISCFHH